VKHVEGYMHLVITYLSFENRRHHESKRVRVPTYEHVCMWSNASTLCNYIPVTLISTVFI